ncbi:MAG: LON peptidase substrate-binding domain-containing protein, partial [bacterium]
MSEDKKIEAILEEEIDFEIPQMLPVLPLRNTVIFPQQILPLQVGREKSLALVEGVLKKEKLAVVVAQKDAKQDDPEPKDLFLWGTIVQVIKVFRLPDGTQSVMVQGLDRARILDFVETDPFLRAAIQIAKEEPIEGMDIEAMVSNLQGLFQKAVELAPYLSPEHAMFVMNLDAPARLADAIAGNVNVSLEEKQAVLEQVDLRKRLERVTVILTKELQILELGSKIQ